MLPNRTKIEGVEALWYRCPDCLNLYYDARTLALLRFANDRRNYVLDFDVASMKSAPQPDAAFALPAACHARTRCTGPIPHEHACPRRGSVHRDVSASPDVSAAPAAAGGLTPLVQDFAFEVRDYNSTRMYGSCLNFIVKYRYPPGAASYVNYLDLRAHVMRHAEPSAELPAHTFWEEVNRHLVSELSASFNLSAVSCQIQVKHDHSGRVRVGGGPYGSVVTFGDMPPVDEPLTNAFDYSKPCAPRPSAN